MIYYIVVPLLVFITLNFVYKWMLRRFILKPNVGAHTKILITGGCMGIGRLTATIFAKMHKSTLIILDIREDLSAELLRTLKEHGSECYFYKIDLSDREATTQLCRQIISKHGFIDIIVNNAAIVYGKTILESTNDQIKKIVDVNFMAPLHIIKEFLPLYYKENRGHIVSVASIASHITGPSNGIYSASKFALYSMHTALRIEIQIARKNIDTTIICPYAINTGMFEGFKPRLQQILPILDQNEVSKRIYEAIVYKEKEIFIPWFARYMKLLYYALPLYAQDIGNIFLVGQSMHNFTGREMPLS